jgi:Spy/CpxP family protein refolding chaperone
MHTQARWTRLIGVTVVACSMAACAPPAMMIPAAEVDELLTRQHAAGLTREQSASLRALLEQSRESQRALQRHLREESRKLDRLIARMDDDRLIDSPLFWAQIGLVHQVRVERLLAPVLLREGARSHLTAAQREWFERNRLVLIFPP